MTTPKPGVYRDVPPADYHSWKLASNGALTALMRSPAHLKTYLEDLRPDTPPFVLGRAIHAAVLEPDRFTSDYTFFAGDKRTRDGRLEYDELLAEHDEGNVLSHTDWQTCLAVRDAVRAEPEAWGLISGKGDAELSLVWKDETGVKCKARWDRWSPDLPDGVCVDLKTTTDASKRAFERAIFAYGYHRQGTLYMRGGKALQMAAKHYAIIAVEKEPPYGVGIYRLRDEVIEHTTVLVERLLRKYARCLKEKSFPGYGGGVEDIGVPPWAYELIEVQTEEVGA